MFSKLFAHNESRRILTLLGAASLCALFGWGVYSAAINAVTPTLRPITAQPPAQAANIPTARTITIKGYTIRVDLAESAASREQGLSGREGLAPDQGMLFVFPTDGIYAFWMKNMRFSIDMVWLAKDGTVVYIVSSASPESYPTDFVSTTPARYVVELPAGWAHAHDLTVGDSVQL